MPDQPIKQVEGEEVAGRDRTRYRKDHSARRASTTGKQQGGANSETRFDLDYQAQADNQRVPEGVTQALPPVRSVDGMRKD